MVKGTHLILDVICTEKDKLVDRGLMRKVLLGLPELVNMRRLIDPVIVEGPDYNPGLTGVVVIETSNIILHTFLDSGKFSLDVFSVKDIDVDDIVSYLRKSFDFDIIRKDLIDRL